jgi:hypothetical protein
MPRRSKEPKYHEKREAIFTAGEYQTNLSCPYGDHWGELIQRYYKHDFICNVCDRRFEIKEIPLP